MFTWWGRETFSTYLVKNGESIHMVGPCILYRSDQKHIVYIKRESSPTFHGGVDLRRGPKGPPQDLSLHKERISKQTSQRGLPPTPSKIPPKPAVNQGITYDYETQACRPWSALLWLLESKVRASMWRSTRVVLPCHRTLHELFVCPLCICLSKRRADAMEMGVVCGCW